MTLKATIEWIPCSERLPEVDKQILLCCGRQVLAGTYTGDYWSTDFEDFTGGVSHWAELPAPPADTGTKTPPVETESNSPHPNKPD